MLHEHLATWMSALEEEGKEQSSNETHGGNLGLTWLNFLPSSRKG